LHRAGLRLGMGRVSRRRRDDGAVADVVRASMGTDVKTAPCSMA
jgi:hypothetical protein